MIALIDSIFTQKLNEEVLNYKGLIVEIREYIPDQNPLQIYYIDTITQTIQDSLIIRSRPHDEYAPIKFPCEKMK